MAIDFTIDGCVSTIIIAHSAPALICLAGCVVAVASGVVSQLIDLLSLGLDLQREGPKDYQRVVYCVCDCGNRAGNVRAKRTSRADSPL